MRKHYWLLALGALGILVGLPYAEPDRRALASLVAQAGIVFLAAGLAAWAVIDALRGRQD